MDDRTSKRFLSLGIELGATDKQRQEATDDYLKAAGFDLHGDRNNAESWLGALSKRCLGANSEREAEHLEAALKDRAALSPTQSDKP